MNLYIFNESSRAAVYGIGTYIRELSSALCGSNINVCIVYLRSDKPQICMEETGGIRNWYFPSPTAGLHMMDYEKECGLYYRNIVYLLQLHIQDKENLVFHLNHNQNDILAEELRKGFRCKIVCSIHYLNWCFSLLGNINRFRYLLKHTGDEHKIPGEIYTYHKEKKLFDRADRILCLSDRTAEILKTDYHIPAPKISVVYNGLADITMPDEKEPIRQKFRIPAGCPLLLFAGRLESGKGLDSLLQAFRMALDEYPSCRLIIAGNGDYDQYMKHCTGIWTSVSFTGLIDRRHLYELYWQISESCPLSMNNAVMWPLK